MQTFAPVLLSQATLMHDPKRYVRPVDLMRICKDLEEEAAWLGLACMARRIASEKLEFSRAKEQVQRILRHRKSPPHIRRDPKHVEEKAGRVGARPGCAGLFLFRPCATFGATFCWAPACGRCTMDGLLGYGSGSEDSQPSAPGD